MTRDSIKNVHGLTLEGLVKFFIAFPVGLLIMSVIARILIAVYG